MAVLEHSKDRDIFRSQAKQSFLALALTAFCLSVNQTSAATPPAKGPYGPKQVASPLSLSLSKNLKYVTANQDLGIEEYRLPNGLTVLLANRKTTPVVTVNMVFRVGSRNEAVGYTGSTHFLEHMMFKGTHKHDPLKQTGLDDVLKQVGGVNNATTSYDRTNYYEVVPKNAVELCIELEADRMRGLLLRDSDRKAEMTVVRNELERGEDEPNSLLETQMFATAFREHPYHHPVIGWRSDVEGVPTARLRQFYNDFYHPDNATLIVAGDFDKNKILAMVEKYFGPIPRASNPYPAVYTTEPAQEGERRFIVSRGKEQPRVWVGFHVPEGKNAATYPLDILSTVLGGDSRKSSRLYKRLIETGLCSEANAFNFTLRDPGLFIVEATVAPQKDPRAVEAAILSEVDKLTKAPITEQELSLAKSALSKRFRLSLSDTMGLVQSVTEGIAVADWKWWAKYPDEINKVTAENSEQLAAKFFKSSNRTVGYYLPKDYELKTTPLLAGEDGEGAEKKVEPVLAQTSDSEKVDVPKTGIPTNNAAPAKPEKKILADVAENTSWVSRIERYKLPNGMTVLLGRLPKASPNSKLRGTVAISGKIRAGDYFTSQDRAPLPEVLGDLLSCGTEDLTKEEVSRQLDEIGTSLDFENGTYFQEFDTEVAAEDLPHILALVSKEIRQPRLSQSDLDLTKHIIESQIHDKTTDTSEVSGLALMRALYKPGSVFHPPTFDEQLAQLKQISRDDVVAYHKKHFIPANMTMAIIGDFDPDEARAALDKYFGDWQGGAQEAISVEASVVNAAAAKEAPMVHRLAEKSNVDIAIGRPIALSMKDKEYLPAFIGNAILGYDSFACRLAPVRDRLGLTYGISSRIADASYRYSPWAIDLSVNPENVKPALKAVHTIVDEFVKKGITPTEMKSEKAHLTGVYQVSLRSLKAISRRLTEYEQVGIELSYLDSFGDRVKKVSIEQVNQAIGKYFDLKAAATSIAGDVDEKTIK
ncbi:MAG: insulinase family protein [Cyanobacteria bacterium REEB67]|nr:insulinase family protein [Cyanobacteria bacterium REEB67]